MDKRIANRYLTARRAGVCLDGPLPHFQQMLQAVIYLCQACDLPLRYRFRPTPDGPVSQQLKIDHAQYLENPRAYIDGTSGRDLFRGYAKMVDPVRDLKAMSPFAGQMQTAADIHFTSAEARVPYSKAAQRVLARRPDVKHLMDPLLAAMDHCDIRPRWERKLSISPSGATP